MDPAALMGFLIRFVIKGFFLKNSQQRATRANNKFIFIAK